MTPNDVRSTLETTRGIMSVSLPKDGQMALEDVILALGHDPAMISDKDLGKIGARLLELVRKDPPWGRSYMSNVLRGRQKASGILMDAIMRLGALIDGTHVDLAHATQMTVMALGDVKPGALILGDSRRCANPGCPVEFVPRVPWQACHSAECARAWRLVRASAGSTGSPTGKGGK